MCAELAVLDTTVDTVSRRAWNIDDTVNDSVRYVNALRAELAGQRLAQGPAGKHTRGESGKVSRTTDGRRCAGGDERGRVLRA